MPRLLFCACSWSSYTSGHGIREESSEMSSGNNIKMVRIDLIDADTSNQIRNPEALKWDEKGTRPAEEEQHITELVKELENGGKGARFKVPLDVVINERNPDKPYILTDGFHRYAAYKRRTKRSDFQVKVRILEGGIEQARLIAHQNNTTPKLGMTRSERVQSAWERFAEGAVEGLSVREAAGQLRVSVGHISNMQDALKQIREGHLLGKSMPDYPWFTDEDTKERTLDHRLWRKEVWRALKGWKEYELPEQEHPVADAMLKKWREQIIEHTQKGDPAWFLKQAELALYMAVGGSLEDDGMYLDTKVDARVVNPEEEGDF